MNHKDPDLASRELVDAILRELRNANEQIEAALANLLPAQEDQAVVSRGRRAACRARRFVWKCRLHARVHAAARRSVAA